MKAYILKAQNKDYLVIRKGQQDLLLGTFRTEQAATLFLKAWEKENV